MFSQLVVCTGDAAVFTGLEVIVGYSVLFTLNAALILMNGVALMAAESVSNFEAIGIAFASFVADLHESSAI